MVKKIGVFITILGLFFVGIPQFNSNASMVLPINGDFTLGTISYQQNTSTDYTLVFDVPKHNTSTSSIRSILENVADPFDGFGALFIVRQPKNITFDYELRNKSDEIIEIMSDFDSILFMSATDEMLLLLNGNTVKTYNYSNGIEKMTLRYTGGLVDDYVDGYNEARGEYGIYFNNDWRSAEWFGNREYTRGLAAANPTDPSGFSGLLTSVFSGLGALLSIELLPNIHIGAIIAVPLVFGIIFFILGKRKGE